MELLFDDEWIDRKAGVRRVHGPVNKEPEPILKSEMPWETAGIGGTSVIFDREEGMFKLWYRSTVVETVVRKYQGFVGSSERETGTRRVFLCYAESKDGISWTRPSLGICEFQGNRDNNILRELGFEGDGVFFNVIKDPQDPDSARRYRALGFDTSAASSVRGVEPGARGVCVCYSRDGFHWEEPKLIMSTNDVTDSDCVLAQRDAITHKWIGYFRPRTHPKRRFIGYSESADFDHWTHPRMLLTPDSEDDPWTEFYGLTVACVGRWRIGCLWVMHNNPDYSPMTIELVYSRDGRNYHRAMPRVQFLPLGSEGSPDSRMITTFALIERDKEFLLYYHGTNQEHGSDRSKNGTGGMQMPKGQVEGEGRKSILGVARILGRNFCGLQAEVDGVVETKWLSNYGEAGVQAYVQKEKDGWIKAEILDQYGNVIPGWDASACSAREDADGRLGFYWGREDLVGGSGQISDKQGRVGHIVKLRFHLHKATLYAFQVGEEDSMPPYV